MTTTRNPEGGSTARRDALPEYGHYPADKGCEYARRCLQCPFRECHLIDHTVLYPIRYPAASRLLAESDLGPTVIAKRTKTPLRTVYRMKAALRVPLC